METIHHAVDLCACGIELLAVAVIVVGVLLFAVNLSVARYLIGPHIPQADAIYKRQLAKPLLLGLDLLVAGDVIRTVALQPTLSNVAALGLLAVVRTFISWSLIAELEGRLPWQRDTGTVDH